ncbi:uncharacterized protein LOC143152133 isoform X2 [Ptiloglossa arizonensis]|uniref:uncharacterized protein LOC143152133 isoform X2 n=1 Tax=Ptiloglossa arizonensis TaxID=3350558 RepID=UPI003FA19192
MVHGDSSTAANRREEDSSKMAKATAMSLPRLEKKSIPVYTPADSIVLRLSNDFEGIIEQIESLRLARDTGKWRESMVEQKTREPADREQFGDRPNYGGPLASNSTTHDGGDNDDDEDDDNSDSDNRCERLVERGPIKSQLLSTPRDRPYWTTSGLIRSYSKTNETSVLDYDETAVQILRDKEYSEKLNACLDQLQEATKTVGNSWSDKDRNALEACNTNVGLTLDSSIQPSPSDPTEDTLLEILSRGAFQPAQNLSDSNLLGLPETTTEWQDSFVGGSNATVSRCDSRGSSCARSPASVTYAEPLQMPRMNLIYSPVGSPQVAATTYRPQQLLSSSSNSSSSSSSCFSSSSNQSYGDTPSPTDCRVPFCSRIEEQLGEDLENLSFWNDACESLRANGAGNTVGATDIVDTIDNNELQLIEEVLRGLGEEKLEKQETRRNDTSGSDNVAGLLSFVNPLACQEFSLREDPVEERYLTRFESNVHSNRDRLAATESKSNVTFTTRSNIPYVETMKPIAINVADQSRPTQPKTTGTDSCAGGDIDFPSLFQSACHSSPTVDVTVVPDVNAQLSLFERQRRNTNEEFSPAKWTDTNDDFRIPKMVACFEPSSPQRRRNSGRSIMPWPSLNLPSVKASERLKEGLDPKEVERAMSCLLKRSVEELAKQDEDGDTMLMCLVGNPEELADKKAYLAPLVERLSIARGALTVTNNRDEDALYLAALNCPQFSYVTGYLAATMLQKGIDVSQRLYHTRGDTLIHSVAAQGDSHGEILAELLALKTIQGNAVFDLSKRNYDGKTALHVAVQSHDPSTRGVVSVATVKLLLKYGADPKIKETKCGNTALHTAVSLNCDPALVKVLLTVHDSDLVNATNYNHNTALHLAAAISNSVSLDKQRDVFWLLVHAGGYTNLPNRQGKTPLALVSSERKPELRKIVYKRL